VTEVARRHVPPHSPIVPTLAGFAPTAQETGNDSEPSQVFKTLYENRILYLRGPLEDTIGDTVAAQLMALDAQSDRDVTLYINSPGGIVTGMFAIYDVMQLMRSRVNTICVGVAASAAAFLLATGTGVRAATPNARIMFHQPSSGAGGTTADVQIQARQIVFLRERLYQILADRMNQDLETIRKDSDRDFWLSAEEAVEYGAIDEVRRRGGISMNSETEAAGTAS